MDIRNTYAKYERPVSCSKKVMGNVQKKVKGHGEVTRQNLCYHHKGLVLRNTFAKYEALSLRIKKLRLMIKFVRRRSKVTVKDMFITYVPPERSCHKKR